MSIQARLWKRYWLMMCRLSHAIQFRNMSRRLAARASPVLVAASGLGMSMYLYRRWVDGSKEKAVTCLCQPRLEDKVVVITGATSGIGYQVALECAKRKACVYFGARDANKGAKVAAELKTLSDNQNIFAHHLDLTDLKSCKQFTQDIIEERQEIDFLVNNAAILNQTPKKTKDGFELTWQSNYLGHVVVTENLLDHIGLGVTGNSGIIFVNSNARTFVQTNQVMDTEQMKIIPEFKNFEEGLNHYALTKRALWMYATYLAYSQGHLLNYKVFSVDPGSVWTNIFRDSWWGSVKGWFTRFKCSRLMRTPVEGAQTVLHCMQAPILNNGSCMKDCDVDEMPCKDTIECSPSFVANSHKFLKTYIPSQNLGIPGTPKNTNEKSNKRPQAGNFN